MSDKLKPCPFCNNKGIELNDINCNDVKTFYYAECDECGCRLWGDNSEKEAIDRWNERKEIG